MLFSPFSIFTSILHTVGLLTGQPHMKEHPLSVSPWFSGVWRRKGTQGSVWVGNRAHVIWSAHLPPARAAALNQYSAKLSLVFTFT